MRASVRPVWDTTSTSIYEIQCKTCLGHDIDFDVLTSVRPCLENVVGILSHVGAIEYPIEFQMVQQDIYGLYRNERTYDHVVSGTST
ncbi:putative translation initiation factor IF-2 [Gossypium arboreum]|uniref:Putative translation initiation factor IF-2 n=1 Tax=Gossypium arboreum TaxID=29729 RepID=A0A0B0PP43_GOSAR|nr:putative translation initiation factor IF-2 [Gossypium arboreum]